MPRLVTSSARIVCAHGGTVIVTPKQTRVLAQAGSVLCEPDLVGAPITGCPQPVSQSSKPCTTVVSTLPGSSAPPITAGSRPVYVDTLSGLTDGVPPGTITVVDPGTTTQIA